MKFNLSYAQVIATLGILVFVYGLLAPMLVSMASDIAVLCGFGVVVVTPVIIWKYIWKGKPFEVL